MPVHSRSLRFFKQWAVSSALAFLAVAALEVWPVPATHTYVDECVAPIADLVLNTMQSNHSALTKDFLVTKILELCTDIRKDVIITLPTSIAHAVQQRMATFQAATGKSFTVNPVNGSGMTEIVLTHDQADNGSATQPPARPVAKVWVVNSGTLRQMAQQKQVQMITNQVTSNDRIKWSDIFKLYMNAGIMPTGEHAGLPLDGSMLLLYYRKDLFLEAGLPPPETWEDAAAAAEAIDGRNGSGVAGACVAWASDIELAEWYLSVLAPSLQYSGTSQGFLLDPGTMAPMFNNPAAASALHMVKRLMLGRSRVIEEMGAKPHFLEGKCAMTVDNMELFKEADGAAPGVKGNIAVVQLPGQSSVWHRQRKKMTSCTSALCPHGHTSAKGNPATWVNRAPFSGHGGWLATLSKDGWETITTSSVLEALGGQQESIKSVFDRQSTVQPFRYSHLNPAVWKDQPHFAGSDIKEFLAAVEVSVTHPNVAPDLMLPSSDFVINTIGEQVSLNLDGIAQPDHATRAVASALTTIVHVYGLKWMKQQYLSSISYQTEDRHRHRIYAWMILVPVLITVVATIVAVLVGLLLRRHKRKPLFRKGQPPPVSPLTTLVVTDIQDSTNLWETLPPDIMDAAIKLHHQVVRKAIKAHLGYESTTEGDSFILAFHNARDALQFCLTTQVQLLAADWPPQLLALDLCRPFWVKNTHLGNDQLHVPGVVMSRAGTTLDPDAGSIGPDGHSGQPSPASAPQGRLDWLDTTPASIQHASTGSGTLPRQTDDIGIEMNDVPMDVYTFRAACQLAWKEDAQGGGDCTLIFRGLKVRMGVHACAEQECTVTTNPVDSRQHYSGAALTTARNVADAAQGGMVLMSEATYKQLHMEELWENVLLLHCGEHLIKMDTPPIAIYQVYERSLFGRAAYLGNIRSCKVVSCGAIDAPLGRVTIVFMYIVGVQSLMAWNPEVTRHSLRMFHATAQNMLQKHSGYQVEAQDNLLLASFHSSADAIAWCLETKIRLHQLDWPAELLKHELGEELAIAGAPTDNGTALQSIIMRGLRAKAGIDTGEVRGSAHAMTGRMTYRGRVMNRAARIVATATSGQVLCSGESWQSAASSRALVMHNVEAISLGMFQLKGVAGKMEIQECRFIDASLVLAESQRQSVASYSSLISADSLVRTETSPLTVQHIMSTLNQDAHGLHGESPTTLSQAHALLQHLESMLSDGRVVEGRRPSRGPGVHQLELPVLRCHDGLELNTTGMLHHHWATSTHSSCTPLQLDHVDDLVQSLEDGDDRHPAHNLSNIRIVADSEPPKPPPPVNQQPHPAMNIHPRHHQLSQGEFMSL